MLQMKGLKCLEVGVGVTVSVAPQFYDGFYYNGPK